MHHVFEEEDQPLTLNGHRQKLQQKVLNNGKGEGEKTGTGASPRASGKNEIYLRVNGSSQKA